MTNKPNKKRKQSPLNLYRIHETSKYSCVVCSANGVSRSAKILVTGPIKIKDKFISLQASGKLEDTLTSNELSIHELISSINSHMESLATGLLDKRYNFTAFALTIRVVIEKLALLNFILESSDRQEKLTDIYKGSTFDILRLANEEIDVNLLTSWKSDDGWTTSDMISRIDALGVYDAKFIYAYTSRIAHAVNRDASMRSMYDIYHVKVYMLLIVFKLYNATYIKAYDPESIHSLSLRQMHQEMMLELDDIWSGLNINPRYSLRLTTFVHYYDKKSSAINAFLSAYKKDIEGNGHTEYFRPTEYVEKQT